MECTLLYKKYTELKSRDLRALIGRLIDWLNLLSLDGATVQRYRPWHWLLDWRGCFHQSINLPTHSIEPIAQYFCEENVVTFSNFIEFFGPCLTALSNHSTKHPVPRRCEHARTMLVALLLAGRVCPDRRAWNMDVFTWLSTIARGTSQQNVMCGESCRYVSQDKFSSQCLWRLFLWLTS